MNRLCSTIAVLIAVSFLPVFALSTHSGVTEVGSHAGDDYDLNAIVIATGGVDRGKTDSYVRLIRKGGAVQYKHKLSCPIGAVPDEDVGGCGYQSREIDADEATSRPENPQGEFEGILYHKVISKGFPLKADVSFERKNTTRKEIEIKIEGTVVFDRVGDTAVVRSNCGKYFLVLTIQRHTRGRDPL
ncbi:MAG: hypothetical protein HS101_12960 [Planctomycetia bacterium]|nr:hypothetical protein [Planctomycetia bacterium]MCC7313472.1 hypothetical protein [Planctomycetota bacterium]OQZ05641.1 MAG: hypothetical protein B6D36_09135 [Planctomycetes bacterium UTPLA1]